MTKMESEFVRGFVDAILFAESADHETGESFERLGYTARDFSAKAMRKINSDCLDFLARAETRGVEFDVPDYYQAGVDFWFTRAGHGAGFWDGDWPEPVGSVCAEISEKFSELDVYLSDANEVELY